MSKTFHLGWLLILLFYISGEGFAQLSPDKRLTQYVLRSYNTDHGLQSSTLLNIAQTNDGFIWTGGYDGLARFDGSEFKIYNTRTLPGLMSNSISSMEVINGNELLIGTRGKGAYLVNNNQARLLHPSLAEKFVSAVFIATNGHIWLGTSNEGIYFLSGQGLKFIPVEGIISAFAQIGADEVWAATRANGIHIIKAGVVVANLSKENGLLDNYVNGLAKYGDDVYVSSQGGVNVVNLTSGNIKTIPELNGIDANGVIYDTLGNLWISTYRGVYRKVKDNPIEVLNETNGLENQEITDLLFDKEGNAWFTSYRSGLQQLIDGKFVNYGLTEGLSSSSVRCIYEWAEKKIILIGYENGFIDQLYNGETSAFPLKNKLSKGVYDFASDRFGNLWIATHEGLIKRDALGNEKMFTTQNGLTSNLLRRIFFDRNDQLWIGTRNKGLMVMKGEQVIKTYSTSDLLIGSDLIMSISENVKGDIIVSTNSAGFYIFRDGFEIQQYSAANGLKSNIVFNIYSNKNEPNTYWVATNRGLAVVHNDKVYSPVINSPLADLPFFDVLEDNIGFFWIPTPQGILRIAKRELKENLIDSTKSINWKLFGHQDGIKSPQCLGAALSKELSNGEMWIPTLKGITVIHPERIKQNKWVPPVYIRSVEVNENQIDSGFNQLQVDPGLKRMSIRYGSISYYFNEGVRYKVRLEPYDEKWLDMENKREVVYTNLPGGNYTFKVKAANSDGVWNEAGTSFTFSIMPHFYETYLFYILVGVVGFFGVMGFVKFRTYQVTSRNQLLQRMIEEKTSELQKNLDDLKRAQVQLVQSEKMASLGLLTAGIAHEINNPVNFISVGITALEKKLRQLNGSINSLNSGDGASKDIVDTQEKINQLIQDIKMGTSRTEEIISSLRTFSHLDKAELKTYDINEGLESTLVLLNSRLKDRIQIEKKLDANLPHILCYPGQLNQVFMNILSNAVDAIKATGTITISTSKIGEFLEIRITDTGVGIPASARDKIFEPFFTTKPVGVGTGLGLSISYSIIKEHEGSITVLSEVGRGSEFVIRVPVNLHYRDKVQVS